MNELKKLRMGRNITCDEMAERLNISKSFYWQIENNKRKLSYDMALKIAKVFRKKPDAIFYKEFKEKYNDFWHNKTLILKGFIFKHFVFCLIRK